MTTFSLVHCWLLTVYAVELGNSMTTFVGFHATPPIKPIRASRLQKAPLQESLHNTHIITQLVREMILKIHKFTMRIACRNVTKANNVYIGRFQIARVRSV